MTMIIAIDPGASGGIAWNEKGKGIQAVPMPKTEQAVQSLLFRLVWEHDSHPVVAYIEAVTGYMKIGKDEEERENRQPGNQMFKFGRGVGVIIGCLLAYGVSPQEVFPKTWQKPFFVNLKGKKQPERKRILKDAAQRRYGGLKVTLKTADALLLHSYASMMLNAAGEAPERYQGHDWTDLKQQVRQAGVKPVRAPRAKKQPDLPVNGNGHAGAFTKQFLGEPVDSQAVRDFAAGKKPFRIGRWQGQDYVFAPDTEGAYRMIRQASAADIINYPKLS